MDLLWTFDYRPDMEEIVAALDGAGLRPAGEIVVQALDASRNWLAESYQALPPLSIGPFYIYGSHVEETPPIDKQRLLIDAATAFGSGEHGTTSACLLAIDHLKQSGFAPAKILDMGCGSGILAIAAARLWPKVPVTAADNDPECVTVTERHIARNETGNVAAMLSDGYAEDSPIWRLAPFDFIIANILAAPLIEMASEQSQALAHGGYLILSGTLREQGERVLDAYRPHGLTLVQEFPGGEWVTLLLQKGGEAA